MAFTLHTNVLKDLVIKGIGTTYIDQAFEIGSAIFEKDKQEMLDKFDTHPITEEIKEGPDANNTSETLGGEGNLFSFIGFERGSNPTVEVRDVLDNSTQIKKVGRGAKYNKSSVDYFFPIYLPLFDVELQNAAPMPWGTARSWLKAIEEGISGLNYYLFKRGEELKGSRSGPAIQLKGDKGAAFSSKIGSPQYKPIKYLSEILNKFKAKYK